MSATTKEIVLKLKMISDMADVTGNISQIQQVLNKLNVPKELKQNFVSIFSDLERETKNYQNLLNSGFKSKKDVTGLEASGKRINSLMKSLSASMKKIDASSLEQSFKIDPAELEDLNKKLTAAQNKLAEIKGSEAFQNIVSGAENAAKAISKITKSTAVGDFLDSLKEGNIEGASKALERLTANQKKFKDETSNSAKAYGAALGIFTQALDDLKNKTGLEETTAKIKQLQTESGNLRATGLEAFFKAFEDGQVDLEKLIISLKDFTSNNNQAAETQHRLNTEMDSLKGRIGYFFSLTNAVQLFKRAVDKALDTVKELDSTMTEAAVVTDFSVGDMWEKLPIYAEQAQKLGVSINGMYQATTLYYQQGLKTNEAMALGVETMKMAKIAGLESTDATKAMTAALRGFNMALNETSATRVNDVYSQLAAVTAADVSQISTAMEKTASIAASANMEFETTAALLSQIIETTQEAPETAGTAMKTIIARFSEVKSLREQGLLTGTDEEGENIDVNRIQAALRTVGISMEGFFSGTERLDSILLKLAEKWKTLDFETQRYIATTAAGSRQQSRFIAMMSDYGRTMELVEQAQGSAGASQKQFGKTLESLDSKLQNLENAWNTFLMNLANDEIIKGFVDILTILITSINNIIDLVSGGNGLQKSFLSLATAIGALSVGGNLFKGFENSIREAAAGSGKGFAQSFKEGFAKNFNKKSKWFDGFLPDKQQQAEMIGKSFGEAFNGIDFTSFSSGAKNRLKESLLSDFKDSLGGEISAEDFKIIELDFASLFDQGREQDAINNLSVVAKEFNKELNITEKTAKRASWTIEQDFGAAAMRAGAVATALGLVSNYLRDQGYEDAADGLEALTTGATVLAGILTVLPGLFKTLGISITSLPVVGWVIGITTALVSLGIAISEWVETPAEKVERLQKATEEAKEAAENAKSAYSEMLNAKDGYAEMQKGLDGLIKGTNEWKQALIESNQQVLELLDTYPTLINFMERGMNGELIITDKGWDDLTKQLESEMVITQAMASGAKITEIQNERQTATNKLNTLFYQPDGKGNVFFDDKAKDQILKAWEETPEIFKSSQSLEELAGATGFSTVRLQNMAEELESYSATMNRTQKELENYVENFASGIEVDSLTSEYSSKVLEGFGQAYSDKAAGAIETETRNLQSKQSDGKFGIQIEAENLGLENTSNSIETYRAVYEKITGQVADQAWTQQELATKIASAKASKDYSNTVEDLIKKLENMAIKNKTGTNQVAGLISKNTGNLTLNDAANLTKDGGLTSVDLTAYALDLGYENASEMAQALGYVNKNGEGDTMSLLFDWRNLANSIFEEFELITQKALKVGVSEEYLNQDFLEKATLSQYEAYVDLLTKVLGAGGSEGAKSFSQHFSEIMGAASDEQKQKILEMLGSFGEFTKEGDIEAFFQYLEEIGVKLDNETIQAFTADLTILAQAFAKIDLSGLINQTKELLDLSDDLKDREDHEGLSQEEYERVIGSGAASKDEFVWTGQEWIYLSNSLTELSDTLRAYGIDEARNQKDVLEGQINSGNNFKDNLAAINENALGITVEDFLKGADGNLTADIIRKVLGIGEEKTDAQVWYQYDTQKRDYENLTANQNMLTAYEDQMDNMFSMSSEPMALNNIEQEQKALIALARYYGVSEAAINNFTKAVKAGDAAQIEAMATTLRNTIEQNKQQKQYGKTLKTLNEINDKYKTISKDMQGYEEVVNEYGEALNLDMTNPESWNFVSENLDLIKSAAEGNIDSIMKLNALLAEKHGLLITADGNFDAYNVAVDEANKVTDEFILKQYEAGAYEIVETEVQQDMEYLEPEYDGAGQLTGFTKKTATVGQTVKLLRPKDASSIETSLDSGGITSSSSSGGGSVTKWENNYDELYNAVKRINAELRIRESLEREYQRLLERNAATVEKLIKNRQEQLSSLESERNQRESLLGKREDQMSAIQSEYSDMSKYAWYDEAIGQVQIDWDLIEGLDGSTDEELTSRLEEYISKLEEQQELIEEQQDALEEINDTIWEIYQQGKDQYFDIENLVKEAIIADQQKEIDKLSEINESINDTNSRILDSMQEQIRDYRQNRDNQKTEDELSDKQRRLAYLQQDTSGANDLEIMKLQKEIDQGQQDYTDTLIDQKISELQTQNDKAAEQRQEQIDLMQAQLDYYSQSALIWEEVNKLITEGFNPETGLITGSKLETILQDEASWSSLSQLQQMNWLNDTNKNIAEALAWLKSGAMQTMFGEGKTVTFTDKDGNVLTGIVDANGNVVTDQGIFSGSSFSMDANGNLTSTQGSTSQDSTETTSDKKPEITTNDKKGVSAAIWNGDYGWGTGSTRSNRLKEVFGENDIQENYVNKRVMSGYTGNLSDYSYEKMKKKFKAYKTGGLADFTGPAWLDGTKSRPEYILNADQTKAFFTLVDVLGGLQTRGVQSSQNTGDNNYDIDINVESIGSDYDVEQLAGKIKSLINEDARYRNNNAISLMR